jgi:adenylate kinase family enzyme
MLCPMFIWWIVCDIIPSLLLTLFCFLDQLQGRADDNIETIRKRFRVFVESSLPVIQYYDSKGMVKKVYPFFLQNDMACLCTASHTGSSWFKIVAR